MKKLIFINFIVFVLLIGCNKHIFNSVKKHNTIEYKVHNNRDSKFDLGNNFMCMCQDSLFSTDFVRHLFKQQRNKSNWIAKFNFSTVSDTLYILENLSTFSPISFSVWNNNDTLSYQADIDTIEYYKKPFFTKYMVSLITDWNIEEIRKEEVVNDMGEKYSSGGGYIYATRIIFNKDKYRIDCFRFNYFFDSKRDSWWVE